MQLGNRVAVVTGAGQGIGKEISARYALEGARVAVFDRNEDAASSAAAAIGQRARSFTVDVTDERSVHVAVERVLGEFGPIDILVNNAAARTPRGPVTDLTHSEFQEAFDVNVTGVFLMCRAVLPGMISRRSGRIINVASQLGSVATPMNAAYCATKGAILQLTRALALDHAGDGVLVNSLSPGAVLTPRILESYGSVEAAEAALAGRHPIGRIGRPDDIAGAAVFLAGRESRFMTGANLVIDGGYLAQ